MIRNTVNISRNFLKTCEFLLTYNNVSKFNIANKRIYSENQISPSLYNFQHLNYCTQQKDPPKPLSTDNENVFGKLTDEQVKDITGGDENLLKKLKLLMLEIEVLRQDGQRAPSPQFLNMQQWKELLSKETKSSRKKYLSFLFKIEKTRESKQIKKQKLREEREKLWEQQKEESEDDGSIKYGLGNNTIFIRVYDTTINQQANNKLIQAMQFGQQLVIDCSYDQHMIQRERLNTAKQLMLLFAENRAHSDPFDLHLCNVDLNSEVTKALNRHIPPLFESWFPLNIHTKSYLDLFPKDRLVYMTPHCRNDLLEYDHDAVYIIGAMVDKINNEPLSLAKAKKEGIKMQRLPLDRYLSWGSGSGKTLTINQVVAILNDIKIIGDWNYALRHVPRRKIIEPDYDNLKNKVNELLLNKVEKRNTRIFKNSIDFDKEKLKVRRKMKKSLLLSDVFKN